VEALQDVSYFNVVEVGDARAAFKPGANFAGVVLEALERVKLRRVDHGTLANYANLAVTLQNAVKHIATSHGARALDAEGVADFGAAQIGLLNDRLEQALHCFFELVGNLIDDGVRANVDTLALREFQRFAIRTHAECDNDRARSGGQQDVVLGNRAN